MQNLVEVVGHVFHVLWQLVQLEIRLLGEVGHDHLVVALTSTVDLKEFAWVGVAQLPRLDAVVALARCRLIVQDEQVGVEEWVQRLLLVLEIQLRDLNRCHAENERLFKLFGRIIVFEWDLT